jgi:Superinfection immunity protein
MSRENGGDSVRLIPQRHDYDGAAGKIHLISNPLFVVRTLLFYMFLLLIGFLLTLVALLRGRQGVDRIFLGNVLFGWTGIGRFIVLYYALRDPPLRLLT